MAVNFNDLSCGFREREVVDLINEQLLKNRVSSDFYMIQMCQSWSELEAEVSKILSDEAIPGAMKECCAWSALALATRLAKREKQQYTARVKKLQDELYEQKLLSRALRGVVNRLRSTQEREKQKAEAQLQQTLLALQKVEEERDSLRDELLQVLTAQSQKRTGTAEGEGEGEGQREDTQAADKESNSTTEGEVVADTCQDNGVAAAAAAAATAAATAMAATVTQAVSAAVTAAVSALVPSGGMAAALREAGAAAGMMAATPAADAPAAAPAAAPALRETESDEKVKENDQEIAFDFRFDSLRTWSQAGFSHLLCRSEASVSCEPTMFVSGVTGPTVAVPPRKASRTRRKVKQLYSRRFLAERFNPISGFSCSEKPFSERRVGDWKCDECFWMNFSWRTECCKCGKYRDLTENEGSTPE